MTGDEDEADLRGRAFVAAMTAAGWDPVLTELARRRPRKPDIDLPDINPKFEEEHPRSDLGRFTKKRADLDITLPEAKKLNEETREPAPAPPVDPRDVRARMAWAAAQATTVKDLGTPAVKKHLKEYAFVPDKLKKKVSDAGVEVVIHNGPATDVLTHKKGVTPPGWEETGKTWDDVPGVYDWQTRQVVVGKGTVGGHGSNSLMLHEYGHAVDHVLGGMKENYALSHSKEYMDMHSKVQWQNPYFAQAGTQGAQESFAELFSLIKYPPALRERMFRRLSKNKTPEEIATIRAMYEWIMKEVAK